MADDKTGRQSGSKGRDDHSLGGILDTLREIAEGEDDVEVRDVTRTFGGRGIGPLIVLPALVGLTPLGGVPTVPSILALIIAILAVQIFLPGRGIWLPGFLARRSVSDDKVISATEKLRGVARFVDRWFGGRLPALTGGPAQAVAAACIVGLAALVPVTEVIPFAAFLPMGAIAMLGLSLTLRDGILMILGLALSLATLGAVLAWLI